MAEEGDTFALQNLGSMILEGTNSQLLLPGDISFLSEQIVQVIGLVNDATDSQVIMVSQTMFIGICSLIFFACLLSEYCFQCEQSVD